MKVMIFTSSPNIEGLTAACGNAAKEGVQKAGSEATLVNLISVENQKSSS